MLPATHDSQAFGLTDEFSQKDWGGGIASFWKLKHGCATPLGDSDAAPWASNQLKDAIRHFDLRIYYDARHGEFYS
ncbi:uncharacterized protein B0H18DRAFT_1118524 [Fomitopsis serialis]|uniref:uncharacterized protein n=1 Tax=Fomitopsis serialis TaxID=139415 RepID=UPI002008C935|nr:uncharacterized protein B0H18DRAFT_1118524 [Neoantrodia serialis]KAH9927249.1 hypothetical protein B0H18DRAFT_1118524 [Neoantrodia serialis]